MAIVDNNLYESTVIQCLRNYKFDNYTFDEKEWDIHSKPVVIHGIDVIQFTLFNANSGNGVFFAIAKGKLLNIPFMNTFIPSQFRLEYLKPIADKKEAKELVDYFANKLSNERFLQNAKEEDITLYKSQLEILKEEYGL